MTIRRFTILLCSLLSLVYGDDTPVNFDQLQTRLNNLEKGERYHKRYNPPATQARGFMFGGELLYWQARENGIPYAIQVPNPLDVSIPPPKSHKYKVQEFDFDWDFGARVYGGIQFQRDGWAALGTWTHFDTKAQDHGFTRSLNNGGFFQNSAKAYAPIWADPRFIELDDFVSQVKAKWKLLFNQIDFMFSRGCYAGRYFILEPAIGASGVWIDQHMYTWYKRAIIPGMSHSKLKNNFKGIGLRGGVDTRFCFGKGCSLFNRTNVGLFYGKFRLSRQEEFQTEDFPPETVNESLKDRFWQVCSVVDMQMGFRWDYTFMERKSAISVKLAYDYLIYFSQNQFLHIIGNSPLPQVLENQGDLSLTGGSFSILLTY